MTKLIPVSHTNFVKKLRNFGFKGPYSGGKHLFMSKGDLDLTIPNKHSNKDIGVGLLRRILKQAQIEVDDWNY